jgi:hypothetical protein
MLRLAILLAAIASPAAANPALSYGGTGCEITLTPGQAHVARITCQNRLTSGASYNEGALDAGGLIVGLTINHGPGDIPDTFTITPPDGYVAIPSTLILDENTDGEMLLYPFIGM